MNADFSHSPNEINGNLKFFNKKKLDLLISSRYLKKQNIQLAYNKKNIIEVIQFSYKISS